MVRTGMKNVMLVPLAAGLALLFGCRATPTASPDAGPAARAFFSPEGIVAGERFVLVANTAHTLKEGRSEYGQGFISIIDRSSRLVIGRVPSSQLNPQEITLHEQRAYVLNSGAVSLQEGGLVGASSAGGVDIIDLSRGVPAAVEANIPVEVDPLDPRGGAPASLVLSPRGDVAYLASGTRGDLYKVDLAERRVLRGPEDPLVIFPGAEGANDMTVIRPWGEGVVMINHGSEQLCTSTDWEGDFAARRCGSIRLQQQLRAGPWDVVRAPDDRAMVLMSLANSVARVNLSEEPFLLEREFAATGMAPNRVLIEGDALFIINSLSNNLQRVDLTTGASALPFAVFPLASNPYAMAITPGSPASLGWVTLFRSHQVAVLDLDTGEVLELLASTPPPMDGGAPADGAAEDATTGSADGGVDGPRPSVVGIQGLVSASYGEGAGFGQDRLPAVIQGGPRGGGELGQGTHVLSLGVGGEVTLDFGDQEIVDGPGPDLIIFENSYLPAPYRPFAEPAHVAVSAAGLETEDFVEFSCDLTVTEGDPAAEQWPFPGCAGVRPVYSNVESNAIDPTDPLTAGGDAFDLADLGLARARFLRLRDAGVSMMGPDSKGFDLDAVVLIHHAPRR